MAWFYTCLVQISMKEAGESQVKSRRKTLCRCIKTSDFNKQIPDKTYSSSSRMFLLYSVSKVISTKSPAVTEGLLRVLAYVFSYYSHTGTASVVDDISA